MAANRIKDTTLYADANLIAYWLMDGNSNSDIGSFNGTDTSISYVSGKYTQASSFDGSASKISVGTSATLTPTDMTQMFWFNPQANSGANNYYKGLISRASAHHTYWRSEQSTRKISAYWTCSGGVVSVDPSSTQLTVGTWHHVAVTYNSTAGMVVYVDGSSCGTAGANGTLSTSANATHFGAEIADSTRFVQGYLDDIAIFSRALTGTEISNYYSGALNTGGVSGSPAFLLNFV